MRAILIALFLLNTVWSSLRAQSAERTEIAEEGLNFYRSEMAMVKDSVTTMHTHLPETGRFITATDICTLRLYEKFAAWKRHIVVSKTDVSIWDCEHDILVGRPREEWGKQAKNNEESH